MKEKYINSKLSDIEEELQKATSRNSLIKLITIVLESFTGFLGGIILLGGISSGIPLLLIAALSHLKRKNSKNEFIKIKKNLEKKIAHLNKISQTELNGNEKLNDKRKRKIIELQKDKQACKDAKAKKNKIIAASTVASAIGMAIFPGTIPIIALAWTVATSILSKRKSQDRIDESLISTRISNLVNDINVIKIDEYKKKKASKKINLNKNINSENKKQSSQDNKKKEEIRNRAKEMIKEQEALLNNYISELEQPKEEVNSKQKIKNKK